LDKAFNRDSMRNPEAMAFFIEMAEGLWNIPACR
jgi:hypothetical protein